MTCGVRLDVPEGMRAAALGFAGGLPDEEPLPDTVTCEQGKHDQGEHAAFLRELFDGTAVWVTWEGDDIKVQPSTYCQSLHPSKRRSFTPDDMCWLPDAHRGGHTWQR